MNREEELKLAARVMALEYIVKHLLWNQAVFAADARDANDQAVAAELALFAENCGSDLERSTVSNADPATSDHVAALVSESVQRIVDELLSERGVAPPKT